MFAGIFIFVDPDPFPGLDPVPKISKNVNALFSFFFLVLENLYNIVFNSILTV